MQQLDINTKKGQLTLAQEQRVLGMIKKTYPSKMIIQTKKHVDAKYDGMLVDKVDGTIAGVFESKCRDLSYNDLVRYKTWLITYDKVVQCAKVSELSRAPFYGILYLTKDDTCVIWKMTDEYGNFLIEHDVLNTETKKTVNGGKIKRDNAYFYLQDALDKNLIKVIK